MKAKVLFACIVLPALFVALWIYGNTAISVGEQESRWIIQDMWGEGYFNSAVGGLEGYERINLLSLQKGSSKNQELITYVVRNKCTDGSERCYVIMTSASNLLIDGGEFDSGLRGAVEAVGRVKTSDVCPIVFESAVLKYKIKVLSSKGISSARSMSKDILKKIKLNGGLMRDLRTKSCTDLSGIKPAYFHEYALLVAYVMGFAGGDLAKAGAYIEFSAQ
ncbi:MAG: hypothetical protein A2Y50_09940 [Pseudomonadales bacterium RIFCSPLOWO2_12_59_9]|nr:MAG: hypothetical protein A2Y50_09940 [Pseudomonadales bacterium RIFCSPLOWO2_12_59_9]